MYFLVKDKNISTKILVNEAQLSEAWRQICNKMAKEKNILELLLHYFKMWQLKASQAAESSFHGTGDFKGFRLVCESVSQSA